MSVSIVLALFVAGLSADQAAPIKVVAEAPPAKEKMVCKRVTPIGSNIPGKKVCVTKKEHEAQTAAAREATREMQTANSGAGNTGN